MLFAMIAWVLRFGLFAYGDPTTFGTVLIIVSCIVYGMAFDFSIYRFPFSSKQRPTRVSGPAIYDDEWCLGPGWATKQAGISSTCTFVNAEGNRDWHGIWLTFAAYASCSGGVVFVMFKHKHDPKALENVNID